MRRAGCAAAGRAPAAAGCCGARLRAEPPGDGTGRIPDRLGGGPLQDRRRAEHRVPCGLAQCAGGDPGRAAVGHACWDRGWTRCRPSPRPARSGCGWCRTSRPRAGARPSWSPGCTPNCSVPPWRPGTLAVCGGASAAPPGYGCRRMCWAGRRGWCGARSARRGSSRRPSGTASAGHGGLDRADPRRRAGPGPGGVLRQGARGAPGATAASTRTGPAPIGTGPWSRPGPTGC